MGTRTLLLVDDDPDILRIGELALAGVGGFVVRTAGSGAEALALLAAELPDAVILDVLMPGMDGTAVLAGIRATPAARALPVIFLTGKDGARDEARYRELGAAGVIRKPFHPKTLAREVREVLGDV